MQEAIKNIEFENIEFEGPMLILSVLSTLTFILK